MQRLRICTAHLWLDNISASCIHAMSFFMPLANAAMGTVATKATNNVISRAHSALTGSKKKKSRRTSSKLMRSSVRKSPPHQDHHQNLLDYVQVQEEGGSPLAAPQALALIAIWGICQDFHFYHCITHLSLAAV